MEYIRKINHYSVSAHIGELIDWLMEYVRKLNTYSVSEHIGELIN